MRFDRRQFLVAGAGLATLTLVAGCDTPQVATSGPNAAPMGEEAALTALIAGLGAGLGAGNTPGVDAEEAARAAHIALSYPHVLAERYEITDPPLVHNTKVNMGLRPRGLCHHWAQDMETRLAQENFQTLDLHRAIANADNPFRIEHSTVIISRKGDTMFDGVVLDPWRNGGDLAWSMTREDKEYRWQPRGEVFDYKRSREAKRRELRQQVRAARDL
ncbi:hypothetical protein [Rhodalgimonas zhirmunskyi]|uniref:Lipoprotein n=1 Tax=Rhodalgimonas zhirmunskyi TaxID=2964767 RepID=A0AAJ1UDI2_9RHOB|nr:hypothetical protein [Rhodoalgimonas zhirmunskyi]MDQ2094436.1 hypothetical protein [Rhodoalgimonas zhirmunskyi]